MKTILAVIFSILVGSMSHAEDSISFWDWARHEQGLALHVISRCALSPDYCILKRRGDHIDIYADFVSGGAKHYDKIHIYGTRSIKEKKPWEAKGI